MDITELLTFSVQQNASDLHISAGVPPMIRVDGDVRRIKMPSLDHKQVHSLVYEIMNDKQRKDFEEFFETDFSFEIPGLARFRVNAFNQNRGAAAVFRTIPTDILSMETLGMGKVFKDLADKPRGLVLVSIKVKSVWLTSARCIATPSVSPRRCVRRCVKTRISSSSARCETWRPFAWH